MGIATITDNILTDTGVDINSATFTIDLIELQNVDFYAPDILKINTITPISGSPVVTVKVNDVSYTLGDVIPQGAKITVEVDIPSVVNLNSRYE